MKWVSSGSLHSPLHCAPCSSEVQPNFCVLAFRAGGGLRGRKYCGGPGDRRLKGSLGPERGVASMPKQEEVKGSSLQKDARSFVTQVGGCPCPWFSYIRLAHRLPSARSADACFHQDAVEIHRPCPLPAHSPRKPRLCFLTAHSPE